MATKLNNIKAIRQMLDGVHRTQTKTSVSFSETKKAEEERKVGDVWVDENGVEWEQRSGFRIQKGKMDEVRSLIAASRMPSVCPVCGQAMTKRLDVKFWKLEKRCFDCQVEFEHELRIEGKFEQYAKDRIRRNAEAWLADAEQEAVEIINAFRNPVAFANSDGTMENWSGGKTAKEIADQIESEFLKFKEDFLNKLKEGNTQNGVD